MKALFRIVSCIISVCVFLAAFFTPFFRVVFDILGISTDASKSIYDLIKMMRPGGSSIVSGAEIWEKIKASAEALSPIIPHTICFFIFWGLALLIALAIIVVNAIKTMKKTTAFLGLGGFIATVAMIISFNHMAAPVISGELNIFSTLDLNFLLKLATSAVSFEIISITTAGILMCVAFGAIAIWGVCNIVIELGDNPQNKSQNKKLKGRN